MCGSPPRHSLFGVSLPGVDHHRPSGLSLSQYGHSLSGACTPHPPRRPQSTPPAPWLRSFLCKNVWKGVLCAFEKFWSIRAKDFEAQWPGPTARLERAMTGLGRLMAASRAAARRFCRHHGATASTSLPPPPLCLLTGKRVQACYRRTLFPAGCEREEQHPALAWPSVSAFPKVPRKG